MKKKLLIAIGVILFFIGIYSSYLLVNKNISNVNYSNNLSDNIKSSNLADVKDNEFIRWFLRTKDEVSNAIDGRIEIDATYGASKTRELDITGDLVPEALYSSTYKNKRVNFILGTDRGEILPLKYKNEAGKVSYLNYSYEPVEKVINGITLVKDDNAFYTYFKDFKEISIPGIGQYKCREDVKSYVWNSEKDYFDYNAEVSKKHSAVECKENDLTIVDSTQNDEYFIVKGGNNFELITGDGSNRVYTDSITTALYSYDYLRNQIGSPLINLSFTSDNEIMIEYSHCKKASESDSQKTCLEYQEPESKKMPIIDLMFLIKMRGYNVLDAIKYAEQGANVDVSLINQDEGGDCWVCTDESTPLFMVFNAILNAKASYNEVDNSKIYIEFFDYLLEQGLDINRLSNYGEGAGLMHIAIHRAHPGNSGMSASEAIDFLYSRGAELNVAINSNDFHSTPMGTAIILGYPEPLEKLLSLGVKIPDKNNYEIFHQIASCCGDGFENKTVENTLKTVQIVRNEILKGGYMFINVPLYTTNKLQDYKPSPDFDYGIFMTEKIILKTESILSEVYDQLFTDEVHNSSQASYYELRGINNGIEFDSVSIKGRIATVNLSSEGSWGGVLAYPRFREQINQSAFQFDTVETVEVYLNGEPWDWCMLSESDEPCEPRYWKDTKQKT